MGTRNLTIVILDNEIRIAQYGQWDGYPGGQGATVLEFLRHYNRAAFLERVRALTFYTNDELKDLGARIGAGDKLMRDLWWKNHPEMSRDMGAAVLDFVLTNTPGQKLKDERDFAGDSLFCEYAYVLDFDQNALEVYTGFNKESLQANARFANAPHEGEYHPIRIKAVYALSEPPTIEQMKADVEGDDAEGA